MLKVNFCLQLNIKLRFFSPYRIFFFVVLRKGQLMIMWQQIPVTYHIAYGRGEHNKGNFSFVKEVFRKLLNLHRSILYLYTDAA